MDSGVVIGKIGEKVLENISSGDSQYIEEVKKIVTFAIENFFPNDKDKIDEFETYKLKIPKKILQKLFSDDLESLIGSPGGIIASIVDSKGQKLVEHKNIDNTVTVLDNIKNINLTDLAMKSMMMQLSYNMDKLDIKLDKLLEREDDKLKSSFTSSINLYNQAVAYSEKNNNLKEQILVQAIKELNDGMALSYQVAIHSIDTLSELPQGKLKRSIKMMLPKAKYSQENMIIELDNLYRQIKLIYMGTNQLSKIYIEVDESENVISKSIEYMNNLLDYCEEKGVYRFIDDEQVQQILEECYNMRDSIKELGYLLESDCDTCIEINGKDILEIYKSQDILKKIKGE